MRDCDVMIWTQDPSGAACSLSRAEFIGLAWPSVGRGSRQQYSLLFDSVVACQEGHRCTHPLKEDVCITWGGLCSFLLLQLSDKIKNSRIRSIPSWKPPQEVPCPHRDPVQKVIENCAPAGSYQKQVWSSADGLIFKLREIVLLGFTHQTFTPLQINDSGLF